MVAICGFVLAAVVGVGAYGLGLWVGQRGEGGEPGGAGTHNAGAASGAEHTGFVPLEVDLGAVHWNSEVPFSAAFVNRDDDPVTIRVVRTSCGCTTLRDEIQGAAIAPGAELAVSGLVRVPQRPGETREEVTLLLDTGAVHVLPVRFEVLAGYSVRPAAIDFGTVNLDEGADVLTSAIFESDQATIAGTPTSDAAWVDVSVGSSVAGETELVVSLVKTRLATGRQWANISVSTTDAHRPHLTIPVRANATSSLRPVPGQVVLRAGDERVVHVVDSDGRTVDVVGWTWVDGDSGADVSVRPDGGRAVLTAQTSAAPQSRWLEMRVAGERVTRLCVSVVP